MSTPRGPDSPTEDDDGDMDITQELDLETTMELRREPRPETMRLFIELFTKLGNRP